MNYINYTATLLGTYSQVHLNAELCLFSPHVYTALAALE